MYCVVYSVYLKGDAAGCVCVWWGGGGGLDNVLVLRISIFYLEYQFLISSSLAF